MIDLQINQTPYSSLYALVKDRVYLNRSFVVPGTQDRPEPERASVQLAIDGTSARERRSG